MSRKIQIGNVEEKEEKKNMPWNMRLRLKNIFLERWPNKKKIEVK